MVDESVSPVATTSSDVNPSKAVAVKKPAKAKNPKPKPDHPSTADMVNTAIKTLAERNGSSLQAIKKYMAANYKLDTEKHALFIKRYLKTAVTAGTLIQTKGKGASGSFKLVKKAEPKPKAAAPKEAPSKKAAVKKTERTASKSKKEASPKKVIKEATEAKKAAKPKIEKVAKPKSPSKAKKATKGPTAKPKVPKPKKATPKAKPAAKKAVAQKK